jgi:hypothetical protein
LRCFALTRQAQNTSNSSLFNIHRRCNLSDAIVNRYFIAGVRKLAIIIATKRLLLIVFLLLPLLAGCSGANNCQWPPNQDPATRVLFLGNSYTYVNDLPGMFARPYATQPTPRPDTSPPPVVEDTPRHQRRGDPPWITRTLVRQVGSPALRPPYATQPTPRPNKRHAPPRHLRRGDPPWITSTLVRQVGSPPTPAHAPVNSRIFVQPGRVISQKRLDPFSLYMYNKDN